MAVYPPICIAGTEEGEIFIVDWRNYTEMERGAGRIIFFLNPIWTS